MRTLDAPDATSSPLLIEHSRSITLEQLPFALPKAIAEANLSALGGPLVPHIVTEDDDELMSFARKRRSPRAAPTEADHDD